MLDKNSPKNRQDIEGNNNTVSGRDSIINHYALNNELILEGITKKLSDLDKKVLDIIPSGIYNRKQEKPEPFESHKLLSSLLEIAIPIPIAFDLIEIIPKEIEGILHEEMGKKISTKDIRRIIYSGICSMDYSKYGTQIEKWGENYARKYGNPDIQVMVKRSDETLIPLEYSLIVNELLPELLLKCYGEDLIEYLKIKEHKNILSHCATEIIEKVKHLNIYTIRYSTLHKLAYDLATQPPHPWFTNESLKNQHRNYHKEKAGKHYNNLIQNIDFIHSLKECIEHTCSILLTQYLLFVGTGRLRPLHMLLSYLEQEVLDNGNALIWERTDLGKLKGDLVSTGFNMSNFKILLSKIRSKCVHFDRYTKEENRQEVISLVRQLYKVITKISENYDELNSFPKPINSINELINSTIFLFSLIDTINFNHEKYFFKHNCTNEVFSNIQNRIRLGFVFKQDDGDLDIRLSDNCQYCDTIYFISNLSLTKTQIAELKEQAATSYFIVSVFTDLHECVINMQRYESLLQLLSESFV